MNIITVDGTVTNVYGLDTRGAAVNPQNGCYGGYLTKKFMDPAIWGATDFNTNVAIEIRYAEILFNYAEACLALGDTPTATKYINMIRSISPAMSPRKNPSLRINHAGRNGESRLMLTCGSSALS